MNSTPQSASGARRRLQDRPGHRRCPRGSRISSSRRSSMLASKCSLRSSIVAPGIGADAAGDHARRHPLRVGVDRARSSAPPSRRTPARAARAHRGVERRPLGVVERQARRAAWRRRAARRRPCAALKYWTSLGVMSRRASGSRRGVDLAGALELARAAALVAARRTRAGATFGHAGHPAGRAGAKPSSAQSSPPTSTSSRASAASSAAMRRASPEHSLTATTPSTSRGERGRSSPAAGRSPAGLGVVVGHHRQRRRPRRRRGRSADELARVGRVAERRQQHQRRAPAARGVGGVARAPRAGCPTDTPAMTGTRPSAAPTHGVDHGAPLGVGSASPPRPSCRWRRARDAGVEQRLDVGAQRRRRRPRSSASNGVMTAGMMPSKRMCGSSLSRGSCTGARA